MSKLKRVVFKVHSPYSLFTASIISMLYYSNYEKIIIMHYGNISDKDQRRIIGSGVFDKIIFINNCISLNEVEIEVKKTIKVMGAIDELFIAAYELPFERILEKMIDENVILNLIPEGCGAINYQIKIYEHVKRISGKQQINVELEKKYPVDFSRFDRNWTYDLNMPHGSVKIPMKFIELKSVINNNQLINIINKVFEYEPDNIKNKIIFYIDVNFSNLHRMNMELECVLIDTFFSCIGDNNVIVKPHPTQDYYFEKMKFDYANSEIIDMPRVPFELIYLNIISQYETTDITIIDPMTSTATWSALLMSGEKNSLTIISYNQIEGMELHEFDNVLYYRFTHDYYMKIVNDKANVSFYEPRNVKDFRVLCKNIFNIGFNDNLPDDEDLKEKNSKFNVIGNLFSKSFISFGNTSKYAWFLFDKEICRIKYYINGHVDIDNILWFPSENNIFWRYHELSIIIGKNGKEILINHSNDESSNWGIIGESNGSVKLNCKYKGTCEYLVIECKLDVRSVYIGQSELIHSLKWKLDFWRRWFYYDKQDACYWDSVKEQVGCVWVYGNGEIGNIIGEKLRSSGMDVIYIESTGKTKDGVYIYGMDELDTINKTPTYIVITPMYDYINIYLSFSKYYQKYVKSLGDFLNEIDEIVCANLNV